MADVGIPHCRHHHIILACPHEDCPEQNAYLEEQSKKLARWNEEQARQARLVVAEYCGLDPDGDW